MRLRCAGDSPALCMSVNDTFSLSEQANESYTLAVGSIRHYRFLSIGLMIFNNRPIKHHKEHRGQPVARQHLQGLTVLAHVRGLNISGKRVAWPVRV